MLYSLLSVFFRRFWHIFDFTLGHPERVPADGPVIFAANHQSFWDVPLLATYVDRPISFMAKEELFKVPVFGSIIRKLHAFPVRRGASDKTAIKNALGLLLDRRSRLVSALHPHRRQRCSGGSGRFSAAFPVRPAAPRPQIMQKLLYFCGRCSIIEFNLPSGRSPAPCVSPGTLPERSSPAPWKKPTCVTPARSRRSPGRPLKTLRSLLTVSKRVSATSCVP